MLTCTVSVSHIRLCDSGNVATVLFSWVDRQAKEISFSSSVNVAIPENINKTEEIKTFAFKRAKELLFIALSAIPTDDLAMQRRSGT